MDRKIKEIILISGLVVVVFVAAFYIYKTSKKEKDQSDAGSGRQVQETVQNRQVDDDVMKSISAPAPANGSQGNGAQAEASKEVIDSVSAPQDKKTDQQDKNTSIDPAVIQSISAPAKK